MDTREFVHKPVLFDEVIESLCIKPDGIYIDGTAGGAGHSSGICERLTTGRLYSFDRDADAIEVAGDRLKKYGDRSILVHSNYSEIKNVLLGMGVERIDGLLLDLGVSSYQLDTAERGFSYMADAPLDMRMDKRENLSAYNVVNEYSFEELKRILFEYGEEKFAPSIARAIVRERDKAHIETTLELSNIIKGAMPSSSRNGGHHPAKRSFQAIRIEVNGELRIIEQTIRDATSIMNEGGRIAIITFHSLEDRIVKQTYSKLSEGCTCPKSFPVCICGNKPSLEPTPKKPILPSEEELLANPRSRSAKLRVAKRVNADIKK